MLTKLVFGLALTVALCLGNAIDKSNPASPCQCSSQTYVGGATIESPRYPSNYCNNIKNCVYNLQATAGHRVKIVINNFATEPTFDVLSVYDGGKFEADKQIAALSGNSVSSGTTLYSGGQLMTLIFNTDNGGTFKGFSITFVSVTDSGCGPSILPSYGGFIQTPNYPYNYPNGIQCSWVFDAPLGSDAQINFAPGANTELGHDFVVISEDGKNLATYSGNSQLSQSFKPVQGNDNNLRVTFTSDSALSFGGFQANISSFIPVQDCSCGPQVRSLQNPDQLGVLTSPNYGGPTNQYCHNAHCTWYLEVPSGFKVHVEATHFDLETGFDSLKIYDNLDGPLDETCTGSLCPPRTSSNRFMTLIFQSDGSVAKSGFSINFSAVE